MTKSEYLKTAKESLIDSAYLKLTKIMNNISEESFSRLFNIGSYTRGVKPVVELEPYRDVYKYAVPSPFIGTDLLSLNDMDLSNLKFYIHGYDYQIENIREDNIVISTSRMIED